MAQRKTKFTPKTRKALLERFEAGVSQVDACKAVGISIPTLRLWVKRGKAGESGYAKFAADVAEAQQKAAERPDPMDEDELLHVVSQQARKGSVQAMKLRWEMILVRSKPTEEEQPADPLSEFDELAERRRA